MEKTTSTRPRICGLGNHYLSENYATVSDPNMVKFARKINHEFRSTTQICGKCYDSLKKVYRYKARRALERLKNNQTKVNTISSITSTTSSTISSDNLNNSSDSSLTQKLVNASTSSLSSSSNQPTTSAAAAAKRRRANANITSTTGTLIADKNNNLSTDDSDDDLYPSPNATNGTRLPHIQPAPKRRQFVHLNKDVMDIYLAGTTGG